MFNQLSWAEAFYLLDYSSSLVLEIINFFFPHNLMEHLQKTAKKHK